MTLLYLFAFAANVTPYLRGPDAWRWAYAIPGEPWRHLVPTVVVAAYVVISLFWSHKLQGKQAKSHNLKTSRAEIGFLLLVALAVPVIQAALLFPESPDILRPLFYRTVSAGASGVFTVGSTITDPAAFLRRYPELMPTFPVHPQRYPPGLPLLFYGARQLFETSPALGDPVGAGLRLYQCHDLTLMRLSNATIATALVQMALPVITGLIVFPLYGLARRTIGRPAALWAVIAYPLVPSFALWSARWDQFYPVLTCTAWACFWRGLTDPRPGTSNKPFSRLTPYAWLFLGGIIVSLTTFLSFGPLVILAPMGLAAALWVLPYPKRRRWGRLAVDALVFFAGLILPWLAYQIAFGNGFPDIWRVSMAYHLGVGRDDSIWIFYHLYDFFAFLGLPLALLFAAGLLAALRGGWKAPRSALPLGFGLGLLLLDLSGMAQGEVARVWLFLTPYAVIGAAYGLSHLAHRRWLIAGVIGLLAAQLLVFNAFLRVVTTGITDPPQFTRAASPGTTPIDAGFATPTHPGSQIALVAYEIAPDNVRPGATFTVTLTWRATGQIPQPYTVFVHLLGPEGDLITQHDSMPQQNHAPTTCWRPGEFVPDPHPLTLPVDVAPGDYTLVTGLYFWETGERLPAQGTAATPDNVARVTTLNVKAGDP